MSYTDLDYIANELYQADARATNGVGGTRWWCLRKDLQASWRRSAMAIVESWRTREEMIEASFKPDNGSEP